MSDRENSAMVGALMLVAGGIIGAGVALLYAPQSGKKTRRDISRYAKNVGEKAEEILDKGKDMAYDAKKELLHAIEEGQVKLEKQRARLTKLIG